MLHADCCPHHRSEVRSANRSVLLLIRNTSKAVITQQVPGYPPKPIEDHHIKQQMEKPYVGKHMGQDRPWMFGIPKEVIRQEEVVRHFPEQPMLRLEA